jgi:hypothetical protein
MKPVFFLTAVIAIAIVLLVLFTPFVQATQIKYRSARQLGDQSQVVVRGTVIGVRSYWNEQHTKIFTETTIAADETYKGRAGAVVKLTQLGGTVDDVKVTVSGALHWREGEEVLVFLEPYVGDTYHVSGFSQGKFTIERDAATQRELVRQAPAGDAEVVGGPQASAARAQARAGKMTLEELLNQALGRR